MSGKTTCDPPVQKHFLPEVSRNISYDSEFLNGNSRWKARNKMKVPSLRFLIFSSVSILLSVLSLIYLGFRTSVSYGSGTNVLDFDWGKIVPSPELRWEDCYVKRQCARLEVPLDYNDPTGAKAAVALIRIQAQVPHGSKEYRGPILFNPGGPGGSGIDLIQRTGDKLAKILGNDYDIVGFDPRGIGRTTPSVSAFGDAYTGAIWDLKAPSVTSNVSDFISSAYARSFVVGDLVLSRSLIASQYSGTATVARDMLTITRAHGREKLLYWGFSYGTVLGATFASMFPDNVGRLVIDGVVEFEDYYTGRWYSNLLDTDKILDFFYEECAASEITCPLHSNTSALVKQRVENILTTLKATPLPVFDLSTGEYGIVDHWTMKKILFQALYVPFTTLNRIAHVLQEIENGDGRGALALAKQNIILPTCDTPPTAFTLRPEAGMAVMCGEGIGVGRTIEDITWHEKELRKLSTFSDIWVAITRLNCAGWKIEVKDRYGGSFNKTTSFPLLVIGNTLDPVTPLAGAKKASEGFTGSGLLTINTPGHCSLSATSPDANRHIRRYFRDGILPPKGTVCEIEDKLFREQPESRVANKIDDEWVETSKALSKAFRDSRVGQFVV